MSVSNCSISLRPVSLHHAVRPVTVQPDLPTPVLTSLLISLRTDTVDNYRYALYLDFLTQGERHMTHKRTHTD